MKAIVTGATGMIGTALIKELLTQNNEVIAIVRPHSKNIGRLPKSKLITVIECEISELSSINDINAEVFFHIAWEGVFGADRDNPLVQKRNIDTTFDAITLASRSKCEKFVFAGSQAELGKQNIPIGCNNIPNPIMNYGIAKLFCNTVGKNYANKLGMKYNCGRILSAYGVNDTQTTLVSALITKLSNDDTMQLSECKHIWDYINVDDIARAFVAIANRGIDGKIYPVGSGEGVPLKDYVEIIKDEIGKGYVVYGNPLGEGAIDFLKADLSELTCDTGFVPTVDFRDGIKALIQNFNEIN